MFELLEIFRDRFESKMAGIAAIHHPLRGVDTAPATLARPLTSTTPLTGRYAHHAQRSLSAAL